VILAVDSSHLKAVVAVLEIGESAFELKAGHSAGTAVAASESLLPLVDAALERAGARLTDLKALACGVGPGSFTGIRIGLATVKALAQVLNLPLVSVSSLRAVAFSHDPAGLGAALVNAYQGQVFAGWPGAEGVWQEEALTVEQWHERAQGQVPPSVTLVGSGVDQYEGRLSLLGWGDRMAKGATLTPLGLARAVDERIRKDGASCLQSYLEVQPRYLRPAQATLNLLAASSRKS
jgi:tRNA threonylcarbamoyladenosine biosynthesis protein TsaB